MTIKIEFWNVFEENRKNIPYSQVNQSQTMERKMYFGIKLM